MLRIEGSETSISDEHFKVWLLNAAFEPMPPIQPFLPHSQTFTTEVEDITRWLSDIPHEVVWNFMVFPQLAHESLRNDSRATFDIGLFIHRLCPASMYEVRCFPFAAYSF